MKNTNYQEALSAFAEYIPDLPSYDVGKCTVTSLGGGLINHSLLASFEYRSPFVLQQINTDVFPNPEDLQHNYIAITQYAEFEFTGLRLPHPQYYTDRDCLYIDKEKKYWRAFEFIENAFTPPVAERPAQAKATAVTFAKFTAAFEGFNTDQLKIVIPDFHNLSFRFFQFETALNGEQYERINKAMPLIEELKERERYKHFYEIITESPSDFPQRVMHHDAKIANVLFNKKTGKVICPVDFDTVMPGYYFSDIGDLIRSMTCSCDENCVEFDNISIRADFYKAIVDGYLSVMGKHFTESEQKYIHYAGLLMTYMQTLRFITDYLNGDIYYRITNPEQNFDRAKNQLILLRKLEAFLQAEYGFKV